MCLGRNRPPKVGLGAIWMPGDPTSGCKGSMSCLCFAGFSEPAVESSRGKKNGIHQLQRPPSPFSSKQRESCRKFIPPPTPTFRTCLHLSNTSVVHKQASLAPVPSCTLTPLAPCSASVSLFTRPGFFAFPAPATVLFILAQACPYGCLWIMLVSLALCSSKEHSTAGRKSVP